MLEATDGWPVVVSGAIRKAAEDGWDVADAFDNWCNRHGHFFAEVVTEALEAAPEAEAALVRKLIAGSTLQDPQQLETLEAEGLFVIQDARGHRPLRPITRLRSRLRARPPRLRSVPPLQLRMFGRFQAEIEGQPIQWIRRRDQQIVKFIALKQNGSATRAELAEVFWPDGETSLVAQSMRTACCNIRKAIANIVGFQDVDAYFHADGDVVALNLSNVIVDVSRFIAHTNDGDQQYDRLEQRAAYAHYRTADQVYKGSLLIGEVPEPWSTAYGAILDDRHMMVLERLAELATGFGDTSASADCHRRITETKQRIQAARRAVPSTLAARGNLTPITSSQTLLRPAPIARPASSA